MDDTISRKMAIDVIDKIFPADPMRNDYTKGITCGAALATEYIKQLPSAQQEQRWIPCSERYPEENQICIVTDETMRNTYEYRFCKETYDENQGWTYLKHRIIAWMPLPKPYKGEQESEQWQS